VNCNKFPEICLKDFRHVSQQRADILIIFCDAEYNINYYIWLIINEKSKQCVLTVLATRKHFYRQVTQRFRRKLPMAKSVSNQTALWTHTYPWYACRLKGKSKNSDIYWRCWKNEIILYVAFRKASDMCMFRHVWIWNIFRSNQEKILVWLLIFLSWTENFHTFVLFSSLKILRSIRIIMVWQCWHKPTCV
jgi:hypothetical protein